MDARVSAKDWHTARNECFQVRANVEDPYGRVVTHYVRARFNRAGFVCRFLKRNVPWDSVARFRVEDVFGNPEVGMNIIKSIVARVDCYFSLIRYYRFFQVHGRFAVNVGDRPAVDVVDCQRGIFVDGNDLNVNRLDDVRCFHAVTMDGRSTRIGVLPARDVISATVRVERNVAGGNLVAFDGLIIFAAIRILGFPMA